ncbi:MAG: hypothetical protein ABFD98_15855 [Syntrophobacteraceae bacterium]
MNEQAERFIALAKENRNKFLEPFKLRFLSIGDEKERSRIIIDLLKLEPTHLQEDWICAEIIKWMRDIVCLDYLKDAFISQRERDRKTSNERIHEAKDFFLRDKIRIIRKENSVGNDTAFKILADSQMNNPNRIYPGARSQDGGYKIIQKRFYKSRNESKDIDVLPYPYWGYDVRLEDGRVVFYMQGAQSIGDGPRWPGHAIFDINKIDSFPPLRPRY